MFFCLGDNFQCAIEYTCICMFVCERVLAAKYANMCKGTVVYYEHNEKMKATTFNQLNRDSLHTRKRTYTHDRFFIEKVS